MTTSRLLLAALVVAHSAASAAGHEFWIDVQRYQIDAGDAIVADLRVGETFEGTAMSYLPQGFRRFEIVEAGTAVSVEGRMGDRPALSQAVPQSGLAVIVHETTNSFLTWQDFARFEGFVTHKDAAWAVAAHAARGLPDTGFREAYSRHAKALVAVGDGAGADREVGLETEIVALANPYVEDVSGGMPVRLLYRGAPRADAQVEIFEKAPDGAVAVSTVRTDGAGVARVPVRPGHVYMLDAVVIREPEGDLASRPDIAWESLWANLTFAVPD